MVIESKISYLQKPQSSKISYLQKTQSSKISYLQKSHIFKNLKKNYKF